MRTIPRPLVSVYALFFITLLATSAAWAGEISGFVRDQSNKNPLSGALVTLQTTSIRTTTASDGSFQLTIPDDERAVIVAAAKGYFNESVLIENPDDIEVDLLMEAVPQTNSEDYQFLTPDDCGLCHPDQFAQWLDTPMANAGNNTWVHDIYSGTGTPGGMGGFVYVYDSVYAETNPASECASCHQPELWIQDPFTPMEDYQIPPSEAVGHGISCEVCHKIAHVNVDQINYPGIFPGAVTFTRPEDPTNGQVEYGVLGDVDFRMGGYMRASYQPQLVAEVCGACHQDANDPDENHSFNGVISEPTYLEWLDSPYSDLESPLYADCVDCHMPAYGAEEVCAILYPPLLRDPETIRSHTILGTTPEYLENAVELSMEAELIGDTIEVGVDITNSLTGHHVPTGVTVRNMILLVEAWREGDGLQLEHIGEQTVHELGGVGDPAEGYYAGLPGKYYSKVNHDANGNGPTFFTDATGIVFDNRIPALATDSTTYAFAVPDGGGAVQVRARLIYRRAFRFLVDAKQWTEDGHGQPLEDVLPPHFGHLMEMAEQTIPISGGTTVRALMIHNGACPAPLNPKSRGVVPMTLVGDIDFDVRTIDVDSLQLRLCDGPGEAAVPLAKHIKIKDLGSASENESSCEACLCSGAPGADGMDDLAMKFSTREMAEALELDGVHEVVTLELTGTTATGAEFVARGCVKVVP